MSDRRPVVFDDDNPEWTEADFARARPVMAFPELHAALTRNKGGRPKGSAKEQISLRLDKEIVARLRAGGPGWQTRLNQTLRGMVGL